MERRQTRKSTFHEENVPTAGRRLIRGWFTSAANYLGNAAHQKLDASDYKDKKAHGFPEVPGEPLRNAALERISKQYSELREQRALSNYSPSIISTPGVEGRTSPPPQESPLPEPSPSLRPARRATLEVPAPAHTHRRGDSH